MLWDNNIICRNIKHTNMIKHRTKLKITLICDLELCYYKKIFLKPRQIDNYKKKIKFCLPKPCSPLIVSTFIHWFHLYV